MNLTNYKIICKDFSYRGKHFVFLYYPEIKQYGAVPFENIAEDGSMIHSMNGLQLHLSDTVSDLIVNVKYAKDIEYYKSHGLTFAQAICKAMNVEYKAEFEKMFSKFD